MVKDHSDNERGNLLFYMHHPTERIAHNTAFVTPVVEHWLEQEIAQCDHPMKDQSDNPSYHERTLLPQSYISLPKCVECIVKETFPSCRFFILMVCFDQTTLK